MDWRYEGDPRRQALRDYYGKITRLRRDTPVLRRGSFTTLATEGEATPVARELDGKLAVALFNAGTTPVTLTLSQDGRCRLWPGPGRRWCSRSRWARRLFPRAAGASFAHRRQAGSARRRPADHLAGPERGDFAQLDRFGW